MSWKNLSLVLAAVCIYQMWHGCHAAAQTPASVEHAECAPSTTTLRSNWDSPRDDDKAAAAHANDVDEPMPAGPQLGGLKLPAWSLWLAPQPGESMLAYRDRMVPLAQTVLAPHRARVARSRDDMAKLIGLDSQQRAQLDGAVQEASGAIEDKLMGAFMAGDLNPATFKPMTGVALARDVLDSVDQANRRFMSSLREDQKAKLATHPFDFADYMLFSARWEDALGVTN